MGKPRAIFSPGPSYSDPKVRDVAGWVGILDIYKDGLEELGYEVFVPRVDPKLIDGSSTVSKILSYDVVAAEQLPLDADLFLGPPGYSLSQIMKLKGHSQGERALPRLTRTKIFTYVWNNADWWRDYQLADEYKSFNTPYDMSPTWRWINKTALEMCDHVIACSHWVKWTHSKIVPGNKISITPWGVDSNMFTPPDKRQDGFRVLFVGGDPIRKGLVYLISAMDGLEGVELWVAGCSPLGDGNNCEIRHTSGNITKVAQFGMVAYKKMPVIMRHCHVICIPTLEDGIALAIQEGMACGLVPVTSPETAEVFTSKSGFIVDYRDTKYLKEILRQLSEDQVVTQEISARARQLAEQQTWQKTKESFKEVIRREMIL